MEKKKISIVLALQTRLGIIAGIFALFFLSFYSTVYGAGLLKPKNGETIALQIQSHKVDVTINNGFSRTEVDQIFSNQSNQDLEAIYTFPLPREASLSELSLWINGQEILGEVVEKEKARVIYEDQKAKGNETALAEKDDFRTFDIHVGNIRAGSDTRVRYVYYQPLEIDLNIGRYVYPLAEGNVDDERIAFWSVDDVVNGSFSFNLLLKSAFPVKDVRLPGYQNQAVIEKMDLTSEETMPGSIYRIKLASRESSNLSRDIVFYYRLDDTVPARLELIPYKEDSEGVGIFMAVITPGASLNRISEGVDWTFVLDISGSMGGMKINRMVDGVTRVLGNLSEYDRFRIVTFNNRARDLTNGYINATESNVQNCIRKVQYISAGGSTALFEGLRLAYKKIDDDRTTGIIIVTDGVCNVGPTQHADFLDLLSENDIRLFTFVIGNSANRPLMERLAKESGGFSMNISESDDVVGRLIQAKAKVLHECLHDVDLVYKGEKVKDLTPKQFDSLYTGQQLIVFGKYKEQGDITVELKAKISGQDQTWQCNAFLPDVDVENPELERMWALSAIEDYMEIIRENGETDGLRKKIIDLGIEYSLVTDYTSMLILREDEMESENIGKRNYERVKKERQAQNNRLSSPVTNYTVKESTDNNGMFHGSRSSGVGSGPVGPLFALLILWFNRKKRDLR